MNIIKRLEALEVAGVGSNMVARTKAVLAAVREAARHPPEADARGIITVTIPK